MKTIAAPTGSAPAFPSEPGLVIALILLLLAGVVIGRFLVRPRHRTWRGGTRGKAVARMPAAAAPPALKDPRNQISAIARVAFERQPLLNKTEYRVLPPLEAAARRAGGGLRVMA